MAATKAQVQYRRDRANRNNRNSGVRGVYRDRWQRRWRAQVTNDGTAVTLGVFDTISEADAAARKTRARISA